MSDKPQKKAQLDYLKPVNIGPNPVLYKLRALRKKSHINQADMASRLNICGQYYSQIERGMRVLSYNDARTLARVFNMTTDELFEEDFKKQNRYGHRGPTP